ncbi:MAG: MFS transporter [Alphaproteobacteria bacterium]|nr:MFS transporter [Alphaproteobacteria bacterium]MBP9776299.1 MFS transporter [Alphaproteobacteria bacterium]
MKKNITIGTAMIGHALEHYDVTLYGFFAAMLAPLFFPSDYYIVSLIASWGTFALGFLMRPLGGLVFGHLGDLFGRKKALLNSILVASFPTLIIGLLPTYASIGILAPLMLMACRLVQGFSVGGEYSGAAIFVAEHSRHHKSGFMGSFLCATGFGGALLGTLVGACATLSFMPTWGWRLPFLLGGAIGFGSYLLRRNLPETPEFKNEESSIKQGAVPLFEVYRSNMRNALCVVAMGANGLIPLYLGSIYLNPILIQDFGFSTASMMLVNSFFLLMWIIFLPIFGYFADKIGLPVLMALSSFLTCVLALPLFFLIANTDSLINIFIFMGALSFLGAAFVSALPGFLPTLFSPLERYSGVAFHYTLGQALFGGTAPLIATTLVTWTGDPKSPAIYLLLSGFFGLLASLFAKPILQDAFWASFWSRIPLTIKGRLMS